MRRRWPPIPDQPTQAAGARRAARAQRPRAHGSRPSATCATCAPCTTSTSATAARSASCSPPARSSRPSPRVRGITHAIRAERGPFKNITPGGRHIHHMTFGITGLLTVGYLWLLEIGVREDRRSSRVTSLVYGSRRRAHARRVRPVAEPRGRLLDQAGPRVDRRGRAVRLAAQPERAGEGVLLGAFAGLQSALSGSAQSPSPNGSVCFPA